MKVNLPPLHALRHFESAARLGSFKAAAEELHVTQGAVSQQIRELERHLGISLFVRQVRKVSLTDEGHKLSEVVRQAFAEIAVTCRQITSPQDEGLIRIELGTFFSSRWLSKRIGGFLMQHPTVQAELIHCIEVRPHETSVNIAIQYGDGDYGSFESRKLMDLTMQPVAKPGAHLDALSPGRHEPPKLLHSRSRDDWRDWFRSAGLPVEWAESGIVFSDTNVAMEAAASGAGIAIGYFPLVEEDIISGRLALAHDHQMPSLLAYYLLIRPSSRSIKAVQHFITWIEQACAQT